MMQEVFVEFTDSPNAGSLQFPFGTKTATALDVSGCADFHKDGPWRYEDNPIVAILVNNELKSLSDPIEYNCSIQPLRLFSEQGKRMYRHTLNFLLTMAGMHVCPERDMMIGHTLGDGYYYSFNDDLPVSDELVSSLEAAMKELAAAALPITSQIAAYGEAIAWFEQAGRKNSVLLLQGQNRASIQIYVCSGYKDISYEPLLSTTALITRYELRRYGAKGLLLRYPRSADPFEIAEFSDNPTIFSIFQEYKQWGSILSVDCLGKLNRLCEERKFIPFIRIAESLQNKKISQIADLIGHKKADRKAFLKFVLIAGPSSSGKTTFARKLSIQLQVLGLVPIPISLDDYYRNRADVPIDADGNPDLEVLEALDTERLNADLIQLAETGKAMIPRFDFSIAKRLSEEHFVQLPENGIIILEGIHGLNPNLTPHVPHSAKFTIYISALTQLNLDNHNRISTTDNRIIRRIVRDHNFRGMPAAETLNMWPSVHNGEKNYIFPFQDNADIAFNSALDYELAVLKPFAEPLLKMVKPSDQTYWHAVRLLTFLEKFHPMPSESVPTDSLLREFIGGSIFHDN
jgi:uridine kinase